MVKYLDDVEVDTELVDLEDFLGRRVVAFGAEERSYTWEGKKGKWKRNYTKVIPLLEGIMTKIEDEFLSFEDCIIYVPKRGRYEEMPSAAALLKREKVVLIADYPSKRRWGEP